MPLLPPVFPNKDSLPCHQIHSRIPHDIFLRINSIVGQSGAFAYIIDRAVAEVNNFILTNNLSPIIDRERLLKFLRERSVGESSPFTEGQPSHVAGRTSTACEQPAPVSDQRAVPGKTDATESGGTGGRDGGGRGRGGKRKPSF